MSIIIPSREPFLHTRFVQSLQSIQWPMNQQRAMFFVTGAEVGIAYSEQVAGILAHPALGAWPYILTIEDDNLVPPDAVIRLVESIEMGPFDGVGGLYFTKGDINMPQCYGDPREFERTGVLDFRPRDIVRALSIGGAIVECNGIAMGCSLFRTSSFRRVPGPWFETSPNGTQDLNWCGKARRAGMRFACDTRVRVGHASWAEGIVY
jgi:hypothetical protein